MANSRHTPVEKITLGFLAVTIGAPIVHQALDHHAHYAHLPHPPHEHHEMRSPELPEYVGTASNIHTNYSGFTIGTFTGYGSPTVRR